ncbi:30S ribosome-binding factor RbfA [bacterium]|nr:30S ribosome-binding factor RbfA [bacterium]
MSVRTEKIKQELYRVFQEFFLYEIGDFRVKGLEIVEMKLSPDLSFLRVYYSLPEGKNEKDSSIALKNITGLLRKQIASLHLMRKIPEILFTFDNTVAKASKIDNILSKVKYSEQDEEALLEQYKNLEE